MVSNIDQFQYILAISYQVLMYLVQINPPISVDTEADVADIDDIDTKNYWSIPMPIPRF